jgi:hypothetical protein
MELRRGPGTALLSTLLSGTLAGKRATPSAARAPARTGTLKITPRGRNLVDALAALVPAEVLALHALILAAGATRSVEDPQTHRTVTAIVEPSALWWTFWRLSLLSAVLILGGLIIQKKKLGPVDCLRASLPAFAFVGWTMLERSAPSYAVALSLRTFPLVVLGLLGAIIAGFAAGSVAKQATKAPIAPPRSADAHSSRQSHLKQPTPA